MQQELEAAAAHLQPTLDEYKKLKPPVTLEVQRQRNEVRSHLLDITQTVKRSIEGMLDAFQEPAEVLDAAELSVSRRLDTMQECFLELRREIEEGFKRQAAEVKAAKERRDAVLASVSPQILLVDQFLRFLTTEIEAETKTRRELEARGMAKLKKEEEHFVRANQSPSQNPSFKQVRLEIEALEAYQCAEEEKDAAKAALLQGWTQLLGKLPDPCGEADSNAASKQKAMPEAVSEAEPSASEDAAPQNSGARRTRGLQGFWRLW